MDISELVAMEGIRKTLARFAIYSDNSRTEEFSELFTPDGEFVLPDGSVLSGREKIVATLKAHQKHFSANPAGAPPGYLRHQVTTQLIEFVDEGNATGESYFMTLTNERVDHWGRWIDTLQKQPDGGWLFAKRVVITDGYREDSWFAKSFSKATFKEA